MLPQDSKKSKSTLVLNLNKIKYIRNWVKFNVNILKSRIY